MKLRTIFSQVRSHVFRSRADRLWIAAIVLAGMCIYYVSLGAAPLKAWDEGVYAAAARAAVEQGHWLILHLHWGTGFQPFLEKPPLAIWLEAISMLVFGTNEFAVRFPSATATILTAVLLYVFGRDLFDRVSGAGAATVFLTIPYLYGAMNGGRDGGTDMLFVFFGTLLAYFLWRYAHTSENRPARVYAASAAAVLAILTKGFAFGAFALVVLPLVVRYWRCFLTKATAIAAVGAVVCVFLWPAYVFSMVGWVFINEIFIEQVLKRATSGPASGALIPGASYPYIKSAADALDPWIYALPIAVVVGGLRAVRSRMDATAWRVAWLLWWGASVFVLFAATGDHPWYLIPAYIPTALLVGYLGGAAARGARSAQAGVVAALTLILLASARSVHVGVLPAVLANTSGVLSGSATGLHFVVAVVLLAGAVLAVAWGRSHAQPLSERDTQTVGAVLIIAVALLLVTPPVSAVNWSRTQAEHGTAIDNRAPPEATVYIQGGLRSGRVLFALDFYTGARPLALAGIKDIRNNESIRYVLMKSRKANTLERPHEVVLTTRYDEGTNAANVSTVVFTQRTTDD